MRRALLFAARLAGVASASVGAALGVGASGCGPSLQQHAQPALPPANAEAVDDFESALRLVKLGPANYERALARFESAENLDPRLWEAFYDAGWVYESEQKWGSALRAYEEALRIRPGEPVVVAALVDVYLARGRLRDAERLLRDQLDGAPPGGKGASAARVQLASVMRRQGKLDEATQELQRVLRLEPRSAAALVELGLVYRDRKKPELAELVLRRAIEIDEKRAPAWNDLGLVLLAERRDQEAFVAFDKAASLDPSLVEARYNRAAVYLDCGDYAAAGRELARLTEAHPARADGWVALGIAQRGQGKLDEARASYEKALQIDPESSDALYDLGVLAMDFKKDASAARAAFDRFVKAADAAHPRRADVDARLKELGKAAAPAAPSPPPPAAAKP